MKNNLMSEFNGNKTKDLVGRPSEQALSKFSE